MTDNAASPDHALRLLRAVVRNDRVAATVCITRECDVKVRPNVLEAVLRDFPHLPDHACVNSCGPTFSSVMEQTSIAHLAEHVAIDLLVERSTREDATFVGTTSWEDRAQRQAVIELSYTDDLETLRALRDAVTIVDKAVLQ